MDINQPARLLALQTIRGLWADFMARESGTLRGDDPEQLHRMRVAHRRLRVAIDAFAPVLPPDLVAAEPELQWIGQELGAVRDLDVQLEALASDSDDDASGDDEEDEEATRESREGLIAALREERETARTRMLVALTSSRFEALVLLVARSLREQVSVVSTRAEPSVAQTAPVMLEQRYRDFRKAARKITPGADPEVLHRTRRRARKLRFAAEFVEESYGEPARDLIDAVKELQDLFGEYQDCFAAIEMRRNLRKSMSKPARRLAKRLNKRDLERAAALRDWAPDAVKSVNKRWKALKPALAA